MLIDVGARAAQTLFFAGVLGFGGNQQVTGAATAAFGPSAGGNAVPIVLESGQLQGVCKVPDGAVTFFPSTVMFTSGIS